MTRPTQSARGLAQSKTLTRRIVGCANIAGCLLLMAGTPLFGQSNPDNTNALPKLSPPYAELPPTFWEQKRVVILAAGLGVILLTTFVVWWRLRPKLRMILPPAIQARNALERLRQEPEDGAVLSHVPQILRSYFIAAFQLPPGELTTAEFSRAISGHAQIGAELATAVTNFLHRCDEQKFSPAQSTTAIGAVDQALELVAAAEARRRQTEPQAPVVA